MHSTFTVRHDAGGKALDLETTCLMRMGGANQAGELGLISPAVIGGPETRPTEMRN